MEETKKKKVLHLISFSLHFLAAYTHLCLLFLFLFLPLPNIYAVRKNTCNFFPFNR